MAHSHSSENQKFDEEVKEFLKGAGDDLYFESGAKADEALKFLKAYPFDGESKEKAFSMLRGGIPSSADQRLVFKSRFLLHEVKVSPYIQLCNRLIRSSAKFRWSDIKNRNFASVVIERSLKDAEFPSSLIVAAVDISILQKMIKSGLINDANHASDHLDELMKKVKTESRNYNASVSHWYLFPNLIWDKKDLILNYAPQFYFKMWNEIAVGEYRSAANIEKELVSILQDLKA